VVLEALHLLNQTVVSQKPVVHEIQKMPPASYLL